MSVATSTAIAIGTAIGTGVGGIYAAHKAGEGAELQVNAANRAADLSKQSNDAALEFQKQQAALDAARANATQQANYEQFRAHEQRLSDFGQALGLAPRNIPAYQPLPQTLPSTQTTPTSGQTPAGQTPQANLGNLSDPNAWMALVNDTPKLTQWVAGALGPAAQAKPDLVSYYVGKIKGQPGANPTEQAGSANYWMQKLQSDPNVTGIASRAVPGASSAAGYASTMPMATPARPMVMTPALQMPTSNSFASFLG
jgi:hypothetical protein